MLDGDHPEHHAAAAELLEADGHAGQGHSVDRAVYSVRGSGKAYLFVRCHCCAEIGYSVGTIEEAEPAGEAVQLEPAELPPVRAATWDEPALDPDDVPSAGDL